MNTAAAYIFDDIAPLQTATWLRLVTGGGYADNDEIYEGGAIQSYPHPNPPPEGEGTNVAHCAAQTLDDENNNRTNLTDAKGQQFSYAFDALNRNTQMNYPQPAAPSGDDLQTIVNGYDANGNLIQVTETYSGASGTRNTAKNYDNFDRLTAVTDGFNKTLRYVYDANGNRTMLTDPDNNVTRYTYDALNRVDTVTNIGGTTLYDYDRSSLKTRVGYPNGATAASTYDGARRILTVVNRQGAAPVSSYSYSYDPNGNRTRQIENNGGTDETTTYGFDANDRLTSVNYPDQQTAYTYDPNANRITEATTANGVVTLNKTYTYNTRNQLTVVSDNLTPANSAVYAFDANGNQTRKTQGATITDYAYDVKDQLLSVSQNTANLGVFSYDYQGHRIVKDMGGSVVRYAYDGNSVLLETDNTGATLAKFDYGPDRLLSMNHATEGRAYYLFDALGSVANLTNTAGGIQARYQYDAWGNYRSTAGNSFNRFAFTGHEKDNETNLYYFKARFYDPETGRFLNQDAYLGDINTPPSLHRYLYAYSNPTVYIDLTGYKSIFGDATDQLDDFKDWLGERNKASDSGLAAAGIGTAQFVTTLGQAMTGGLNLAANLAQKAVGVDDQQVRDELGAVSNAIGKAADFVVNGDYAQAAKNVHQAAVDETSKAMSGDVTATANLTQAALGVLTLRGGASELGAAGKTLAANTGKAVDAVSAKIANAAQAVRNVIAVEGRQLATAEKLTPSVQRSVAAEVSVGARAEVQGVAQGGESVKGLGTSSATGNAKRPGGYQTNDVDEHRLLSPRQNRAPGYENTPSDNMVQSHHAIQAEWAGRNVPGYKRGDAPAILLESSSGKAHAQVSAAQRQFRLERKQQGLDPFGTTIQEEFSVGYRQLIDAGVPENIARKVIKDSYKYFDSLETFAK